MSVFLWQWLIFYVNIQIVEAAGGKASTGKTRILDLVPRHIHDRSEIFLGTAEEVEKIEEWYRKFPQ